MRIERVEIRQIAMPLIRAFETSNGRTSLRQIIVADVIDENGTEGWGECVAPEAPGYTEEWTESAWSALADVLAPMLVRQTLDAPAQVRDRFAPIAGNRMAKAALETAIWDLAARRKNISLARLLGGRRTEVPAGVVIGLQKSNDDLIEAIRREVQAGYQRVKIKIKPGNDVAAVAAVRERFPDLALMVDANAAYTLHDASRLRELDAFGLVMIEEPLRGDLDEHARLQKELATPICLDESIRSLVDARRAMDRGACRVINLKVGRVGGHAEARDIEALCRERGVALWCGGMLEAGIGRAHNIAIASLDGFTLPGDLSATSRYWAEDIVEPAVTVSARGTIAVPQSSGIGFEVQRDRLEALTVRNRVF